MEHFERRERKNQKDSNRRAGEQFEQRKVRSDRREEQFESRGKEDSNRRAEESSLKGRARGEFESRESGGQQQSGAV